MILMDLQIRRIAFGENKGSYVGNMSFSGKTGVVTIKLTREVIQEIFRISTAGAKQNTGDVANKHS